MYTVLQKASECKPSLLEGKPQSKLHHPAPSIGVPVVPMHC
jgi:hypothetical protein